MAKKTSDPEPRVEKQAPNSDASFLVVGLGASAGGIHALREFFSRVPKNSGIAYVVILHMSPEHESKLAEILQLHSSIPVTQVLERTKVKPNEVYVIPPSRNLVMTDGHLSLSNMIGLEERRSPVDLFFRTLAEATENRAVSVILSGTGANGSMGLKRIKEHGGVSIVQDPNEAEFTDMPRNAIATGLVDYVLPVTEIPAKIIAFSEHSETVKIPEKSGEIPWTDEQSLRDIFTQLRMRTGHDFSNYKRGTVLRRLERQLGLKQLSGITAYSSYLRENPAEAQTLMKDLLISVTNFFRDPASIDALSHSVLPKIFHAKDANDHVRVWVAGCATGEEAYTLAMILNETYTRSANAPRVQVFATDLDSHAINYAREGLYTEAEVADVSADRLRRFFVKDRVGYRVRRELRETVLFAVHNVIKDPPFSHLDLISSRNLLIYLNRSAQSRVLGVMHFALNPAGYLFLGSSESIEGGLDLFSTADKEHHIFQSRTVPLRTPLPLPELDFRPPIINVKDQGLQESRAVERLNYIDLHQRLLEQYAPPSVVVDERYDIVHISRRAGRFLQFHGGEPSKNLLVVVRPELRIELRATLYQAVQNRTSLVTRELQVKTEEGLEVIKITVRPVVPEQDPNRGLILVMFEEANGGKTQPENASISQEPVAHHLEEELARSKSQLRSTVEQYEIQQEELRASNEELQAMNEELRSAAEEMETGKEELQSVNEELTTVNQELKVKIEELSQANNDFANLINSTDIGTIFLDRSLRLKMFTPRARDAFNLIATDIGRSLMDITNKLAYEHLFSDIERVLKTLRSADREVQSLSGQWYLMRILPYRTKEDRIDGVVLTFTDITDTKRAKSELEQSRGELETRVAERTGDLAEANASLLLEMSERRQLETARAKLLNQLVSAQEEERRRLARDLHDQLGQQLTALRLKLETMKAETGDRGNLRSEVEDLLKITSRLDSDVDFLAWELRPVVLDDLGLAEALRNYVTLWTEHFGKTAEFHTSGLEGKQLSPEIENNLYRIAQEALNNVAKHSNGTRVDVLFERRESHAVLIIEDNGEGFVLSDDNGNFETLGITGMKERAALVGGSMEIESAPNKGTTIFVRVPIDSGSKGSSNA